jgi:cytochrome P450 family 12
LSSTAAPNDEDWAKAKPYKSIPTLSKLQTIRSFLIPGGQFYKMNLIDVQAKILKDHGKIFKMPSIFGRPEYLFLFDVESIQKLHRHEGPWPHRRSLESLLYYRQKKRPDIYGSNSGLITDQGEVWQKLRTTSNPILMKPTAAKLYIEKFDKIAKEFIDLMSKMRDAKNELPANFMDHLNRWSLESIAYICLDRRLGILREDHADANSRALIKHIRDFFEIGYEIELMPSIWKYYETPKFKKLMQAYDGITNINFAYIEEAMERFKNKTYTDDQELSILEKCLKINKNAAVVLTIDMLLAGVDTTASAAAGILYCLAKNPQKQEKLRKEVFQVMPDKNTPLTTKALNNMPYLRAVIKEGIRLYGAAPATARRTMENIVLHGYQIPEGIDIFTGLYIIQNDENNYPKPQQFLPERWLRDPSERGECPSAKDAHPFSYLPFGYGKRMCIGKRFAEMEIELFLTNIIRRFKLEWHHPDMKIKSVLVNIPDSELKFRLIDI